MGTVVDGVPVLFPAPEGYVVDLDNPQRRAVPLVYYIASVGVFLSLLSMIQRLYTKLVLMKKLQLDDVFLILACICSYTTIGYCVHMFAGGYGGVHAWEISIDKFNEFMKSVYIAAALYILGGSFSKIALLIFYFRISPERWFAWATWGVILFVSGYTAGIFFGTIFACTPIERNWDVTITDGHCINQASLYIATAVVNIISDVMIFCLPLPVVFHLQIPRRQKIGLVLIFLLGSLTVVSSCVRVSILPQMLTSLDQTWVISYASMWIIIEANLFIICASLPTMRKFLKHVAHRVIGESEYGTGSGVQSGYGTGTSLSKSKSKTRSKKRGLTGTMPSHERSGRRQPYSEFDIEAGDLKEIEAGFDMVSYPPRVTTAVGRTSDDERTLGDDDSARGIIESKHIRQTTVVTIERS